MSSQSRLRKTVDAPDARQQFATVLNAVSRGEHRVIVEKSGIPVAAVVSIEDLERLERLDAEQLQTRRILAAMEAPFRGVSAEEIERESSLATPGDPS